MLIRDLSIGSSSWTMHGEMVCPSSSPHSPSESCLSSGSMRSWKEVETRTHIFAAVYAMEGLKRDANALNKEIGNLRKVGAAGHFSMP